MKALYKTKKGVGNLELREVPIPEIGDNEVLIKVKAAGICGTDLHIYNDEFPYWPPVILGHEFSGTIEAVGKTITDWKVGDHIVGEPHTLACGKCYLCRTGNPQICSSKRSPGWGIDGAFAEYMRWPESKLLHHVSAGTPFDVAALAEPLANVVTDIALSNVITLGDVVVVAGAGPIGIMAAIVARQVGAGEVIVLERDEYRLAVGRSISAITFAVNSNSDDLSKLILELSSGRGADVFIDASGSPAAIAAGVKTIKKLGSVVGIGMVGDEKISFPYKELMMKGAKFFFNISTKYESWDRSIRMLEKGVIPNELIITWKKSLDSWKEIFEGQQNKNSLKSLFIL